MDVIRAQLLRAAHDLALVSSVAPHYSLLTDEIIVRTCCAKAGLPDPGVTPGKHLTPQLWLDVLKEYRDTLDTLDALGGHAPMIGVTALETIPAGATATINLDTHTARRADH